MSVLIGLAVGDALGAPFETKSLTDPVLENWNRIDFLPHVHDQVQYQVGQWTDDTAMALCLARSIVSGEFDQYQVAKRYHEWSKSDKFRGAGRTTKTALDNLDKGYPAYRSGIPHAIGNGTAMRVAPLGIVFRKNIELLQDFATQDAQITHMAQQAFDSSRAIALGVAFLLQKMHPRHVLPMIVDMLPPGEVRARLNLVHNQYHELEQEDLGDGFTGPSAVSRAFLALLMNYSYPNTVVDTICGGGDTDTIAAIAGAMAGAYYGLEGIPSYWVETVEDSQSILELDDLLLKTKAKF